MPYPRIDDEWACVRSHLPSDFEMLAWSHGAMQRRNREITSPETLLRLILLHVGGGLSLEQTALRAREQCLTNVSGVALFKRLRSSGPWLNALTSRILAAIPHDSLPNLPGHYRVRALDATHIQEHGSTGTNWRLHYCLQLPQLVCDYFALTDARGAEHLTRPPVSPGDVILADRAYSRRPGIAAVLRAGADLLVRLLPSSVPLLHPDGRPLHLLDTLHHHHLEHPGQILDIPVHMQHQGQTFPMRLCALRKCPGAEAATQKHVRYQRARRGPQARVRPATLGYAAYVIVLTSLPADIASDTILKLYRCRWQVELAFKRLKSLLQIGHLPKKDPRCCLAWMQAKILIALLIDKLILETELFSPWGYRL